MNRNKHKHLEKARALLALGDEYSLRYCALELRACIELLCYERFSMYIDELPADQLRRWKPQEVIALMLECDPDSDKDSVIAMGRDLQGGGTTPPQVIGESKGITKRFINEHYHKLSSCLHAPTIAQMKSAESDKPDEVKAALQKTFTAVEDRCKSTTQMNFGTFITFPCQICGVTNKRNRASLSAKKLVKCVAPACDAEYECTPGPEEIRFKLVMIPWTCEKCHAEQFMLRTDAVPGRRLECCQCSARWDIGLGMRPVNGSPG